MFMSQLAEHLFRFILIYSAMAKDLTQRIFGTVHSGLNTTVHTLQAAVQNQSSNTAFYPNTMDQLVSWLILHSVLYCISMCATTELEYHQGCCADLEFMADLETTFNLKSLQKSWNCFKNCMLFGRRSNYFYSTFIVVILIKVQYIKDCGSTGLHHWPWNLEG